MSNELRILISGGGTGGHLFPAIAIAQELKSRPEPVRILFVGAKGKIEEEKVPAAGFDIVLLPISGFARKISFQTITFFAGLFVSLMKSRRIIRNFKPHVAVGVGGYASGPVLHIAAKKGIPILLQEQNSFPGITNRLLAGKAQKICVAYDNMEKFFEKDKIIKTGNPIRSGLKNNTATREEAIRFFGLAPEKKTVLSLGGSGGAKTINESIAAGLSYFENSDYQIIWQTGKIYYNTYKDYESDSVAVMAFISRMDLAYKAADVVISRAGAGTISELCLVKKPAVLVPSPNVAEDHQTKNALALVKSNAAILVEDAQAIENLLQQTIKLLNDDVKRKLLADNISLQAVDNSSKLIADEVLKFGNVKYI